MQQGQILSTLYDMALVIGAEDRVEPLALNTLKRLIYHTGYPVGLFLLTETAPLSNTSQTSRLTLLAAIGDYRLKPWVGHHLPLPPGLADGKAQLFDAYPTLLSTLPLRQDYYRCALRLPIPNEGLILLLSPEPSNTGVPFAQIFQPIMANLSKAIQLCRNSEAYTTSLIADRDRARIGHARFRSALDTSSDCIFLIDPQQMRFVDFNKTAEEVLGYDHAELLAMGPHELVTDLGRELLQTIFQELLVMPGNGSRELRARHRKKNTMTFPVEIRLNVLRQQSQEPLIIAVARDITERQQAEEQLSEEKERAQVTLHSIGDGVITTDPQGYVEYLNPIAEELTGWQMDEAKGHPLSYIFHIIHETTRTPIPNPVAKCLSENRIIGLASHTVLISRNGDELAIEDSAAPIRNRHGAINGVVLVFHDVSKAREMAHELNWQASHDSLTGLINRREFEQRLEQVFLRTHEEGEIHTLLYLDLDHFKLVNDTCGHIAGDELLRQLASHLQREVRESDSLARLGGDEFGLLMLNCDLEHAMRVANTMRDCIMEFSFVWEEKTFKIGSSIGIVEINRSLQNTAQVLSNADMACYTAKDHGGNRIHVFQPDDLELAQRQGEMRWVARINDALANNRLTLYAQAIRPLAANGDGVVHYELLLRMLDSEENLISPGSFIPAAERYKLMYAIDRWVIKEALEQHAAHQTKTNSTMFTINLSGFSLNQDSLLGYIHDQFEATGVAPQHFCFEVTETAAISNLSRAHDLILELKSLGCAFALDDFGSGLSSFTYLKNLPVDFLKIDGSFVKDILDDPIDDSMVSAINKIGHDLGLKTIAEYAENDAILTRLEEIGVDYAQGYGVAKAVPLESLYTDSAMMIASSRPSPEG